MSKRNERDLLLHAIDTILMDVKDIQDKTKYTFDNLQKLKAYIGGKNWKISTPRKQPGVEK